MPAWFRFLIYLLVAVLLVGFVGSWLNSRQADASRKIPISRLAKSPEDPLVLYFHREGCPHCALANPIMAEIQMRYPSVGWLVAEVGPGMGQDAQRSYASWLSAAGMKEAATPLIVVGANGERADLIPGFGDEIKDRERVENAVRQRIGLDAVDLKREGLRIPLYGSLILTDLPDWKANTVVGLLGGLHPLFVIVLFMTVYRIDSTRRSDVGVVAFGIVATLALELLAPHVPLPRGDSGVVFAIMRVCAGLALLVMAAKYALRFILIDPDCGLQDSEPSHLRLPAIPLLAIALVFDQCMTHWTVTMAPQPASWGRLFASLLPTVVLAVLVVAHRSLSTLTPRAMRVGSLFGAIVVGQFALILLFARMFSGYGAFWHQ